MNGRAARCRVAVAALLTLSVPQPARASGEGVLSAAAIGFLGPSDVGVAVPLAGRSPPAVVLGWSWQIPLGGASPLEHPSRHRIVPGFDLVLHADGPSFCGRLGYRYAWRHVFTGLGIGFDATGATLSPELALKFAHADLGDEAADLSLHVVARPDISLETGRFRGASVLFGWNFI